MRVGNVPNDANNLSLTFAERTQLVGADARLSTCILRMYGAQEMIRGLSRYCLWLEDEDLGFALEDEEIAKRIEAVRKIRTASKDPTYNAIAKRPHQFRDRFLAKSLTILLATISSENREYYPVAVEPGRTATTNQVYCLYDAPLWCMSLLASKLHLAWIATVCGKLKTDYRYSNTLGWNTFPVPLLTEQNKVDLIRCAEDILLAREAHFPATIATLYNPETMPDNLRAAHDANDEALERIYIGRRFRNDTERLETLFAMYAKLQGAAVGARGALKTKLKKIEVG
jgi:hypothetical protein